MSKIQFPYTKKNVFKLESFWIIAYAYQKVAKSQDFQKSKPLTNFQKY